MLWSCMTTRGVGDLQKVDGCLNAKDYISILHEDLYLSLERLGYLNLDNVISSMIMLLYIKQRLFKNGS